MKNPIPKKNHIHVPEYGLVKRENFTPDHFKAWKSSLAKGVNVNRAIATYFQEATDFLEAKAIREARNRIEYQPEPTSTPTLKLAEREMGRSVTQEPPKEEGENAGAPPKRETAKKPAAPKKPAAKKPAAPKKGPVKEADKTPDAPKKDAEEEGGKTQDNPPVKEEAKDDAAPPKKEPAKKG